MEVTGTPLQLALGISLANSAVITEVVAAAVRRDEIQMSEAAALFESAHRHLQKVASLFPGEPVVMEIAANWVETFSRMVRTYSAETPPEGAH